MKRSLIIGWIIALLPLAAAAQQIPIKTVPVATGDQFMIFPSENVAMGGVSLALADPLHDPFVNPARGIRVQGIRFASAPIFYNVAMANNSQDESNGGRTLPLGMLVRHNNLFGGAVMAWQELTQVQQNNCCVDFAANFLSIAPERHSTTDNNVYAFAMGGARLPGTNLSVGGSVFVAGLNGLEGVRLLYTSGDLVKQRGGMSAFRLGLHQQWTSSRTADLIVLHHRFSMDHEMPLWDLEQQQWIRHQEHDETRGWAVQANVQQPLADGWRLGGQATGNWKWHPKIPNYDIMQIPRDPGNSSAYQFGVGLARSYGLATIGLDVIYEPIWSHTWADALTDTPTTGNGPPAVIPAGDMTVENFFRFHNSLARLGVRRAGDRLDFALGLNIHTYRYDLDQEDFVAQSTRAQSETWSEWTGSLGLGLNFTEFQVRYLGLVTLGTGRPGVEQPLRGFAANAAADLNFLVAPNGALTLQEARVVTHQITLIVPIAD